MPSLFEDKIGKLCISYPVIYWSIDNYLKIIDDYPWNICKILFFIHHLIALFIILPIFLFQTYYPWWYVYIFFKKIKLFI